MKGQKMEITKAKAKIVSAEIEKAIDLILEKHGMTKTKVRVKYGHIFSFVVEASEINLNDAGLDVGTPKATCWLQFGKDYGFSNPESALGKTFVANGKTFVFIGLDLNKPKYSVCAKEQSTNCEYGFTLNALKKIEGWEMANVSNYLKSDFVGV